MNAPAIAAYSPPAHVLEVLQKIEYEDALQAGDPRYVDTEAARGAAQTFLRLAKKFGWDPNTNLFFAPCDKHVLFFGHIGSGKTTELRRYGKRFDDSKRFFVVEVDVLERLDRNNLQYTEVLLAMAEALLEAANSNGIPLVENDLNGIRDWFATVTKTRSNLRDSSVELKAGLEAGAGVPGLIKLFSSLTAAIKTGVSHKQEWREEIRNRFTSLAAAFNGLVRVTEKRLSEAGRAERLLFVIDGTDKMRGEDTQKFFVYDAEQLLAIEVLAIYTAPLHLKFDGRLGGKLDASVVLPMIKLYERDGQRCEIGWKVLTDMLLRRADRSLFTDDVTIQRIVEHCGGHPRELLRLLKFCCEFAENRIDSGVVDKAIAQLAAEYRYFLKAQDYARLAQVDASPDQDGNEAVDQELLHRLALMQYNDGTWRRSHPVVRQLEGYKSAVASLTEAAQP